MTQLLYGESNYRVNPPSDLDGLLLETLKGDKDHIVLCAREGQCIRLRRHNINAVGWWECSSINLTRFIRQNDYVVILDKERVDNRFSSLVRLVEKTCIVSHQKI
jgi:hypothetical protein